MTEAGRALQESAYRADWYYWRRPARMIEFTSGDLLQL